MIDEAILKRYVVLAGRIVASLAIILLGKGLYYVWPAKLR